MQSVGYRTDTVDGEFDDASVPADGCQSELRLGQIVRRRSDLERDPMISDLPGHI